MKGSRPITYEGYDSPPDTYGKGRVCASRGCNVILSQYNPTDYCSVHEGEGFYPRSWQPEVNAEGERKCLRCGAWLSPFATYWRTDKHSRDGYGLVCLRCEKKANTHQRKPWTPEDREAKLAKQREYNRRWRQKYRYEINKRKRDKRAKENSNGD
jgi:hypothetical protein